jgi:hypothetical protein
VVKKTTIRAKARQVQKDWVQDQPCTCPLCCERPASELHHIIPKRMGGNPKAEHPANWLYICQQCHMSIHSYKIPLACVLRAKGQLGGYEQGILEDIAGHCLPALITLSDSSNLG